MPAGIVVVGSGVAGLHTANLLARRLAPDTAAIRVIDPTQDRHELLSKLVVCHDARSRVASLLPERRRWTTPRSLTPNQLYQRLSHPVTGHHYLSLISAS